MKITKTSAEALERAEHTVLSEFHVLELWMPQLAEARNCNLQCKHCYVAEGGMSDKIMAPEEYAEALRGMAARPEFNRMGRFDVVFPGMEPLLPNNRLWFRPLINEAVSLNKGSVGITTNGTLLDEESAEFLNGAALRISHPFTVNVSLDGDEATHDKQRCGKGLWKRTTNGIRRLAIAGHCNLVTNTTITSINASALQEIAMISNDCGARIAAFHPFETTTNSSLQALESVNLVRGICSLMEAFYRDERMKHLVLEFEASNAGIFFHLFEKGIFDEWELIEDETGFLFLRTKIKNRQFLVSLMFHPHHFIRTMRLLHNGGFASCRSIALKGWETIGDWRMPFNQLQKVCTPYLAQIWQEYFDSTTKVQPETFDKFKQFILKGGE